MDVGFASSVGRLLADVGGDDSVDRGMAAFVPLASLGKTTESARHRSASRRNPRFAVLLVRIDRHCQGVSLRQPGIGPHDIWVHRLIRNRPAVDRLDT